MFSETRHSNKNESIVEDKTSSRVKIVSSGKEDKKGTKNVCMIFSHMKEHNLKRIQHHYHTLHTSIAFRMSTSTNSSRQKDIYGTAFALK